MRQVMNSNPPPWQGCQVCRAARALQLAQDALETFRALGGVARKADPRLIAVKEAMAAWDFAKGGRHTGVWHTPVVLAS